MTAAAAAPVVGIPAAPPLPADLEALLRRLRMPHARRIAPDVLATARAQHWEPAETLRALLVEEVGGRDRSALANRRAATTFPTGKTFHGWQAELSSIPAPTQQALRTLQWVGRRENLASVGPPAPTNLPARSPRSTSRRSRPARGLVHPQGLGGHRQLVPAQGRLGVPKSAFGSDDRVRPRRLAR